MPNHDMKNVEDKIYNINLFRISTANLTSQNSKTHNNNEFKVEVIGNSTLTTVIADTGAKVSVCSLRQAKKWKLTEKMFLSNT